MAVTIYIISQSIFFVCILYLMFFKEYIKRKGTNLADKQDIEGITQKIEQVKNQFTQENEFLKSNLQFIINNQLQNSNEERNAIINFFDYHSKWLNVGLQDLNFTIYQRNNIDDIIQKDRQLDDLFTQTNIAQNRISLLVNNDKLVVLSHQLIIKTLEYNHWTKSLLLKLRLNLEEDKGAIERFLKLMELKPLPAEANLIAEREKELKEERKLLTDTYYMDKVNKYKEVILISNQFIEIVKIFLNKTI
jgi:hypothetical protein